MYNQGSARELHFDIGPKNAQGADTARKLRVSRDAQESSPRCRIVLPCNVSIPQRGRGFEQTTSLTRVDLIP